jgi:hypothetical protein
MTALRNNSVSEYDDAYATCEKTYATLCIYLPDQYDPNSLSEELGITPSRIQVKGENREGSIMRWPTAWFLTTDEIIQSKDVRRHIDWLIDQLTGKEKIIQKLKVNSSKVEISCFWLSSSGHGGPMLSSNTMGRLGELGIVLGFDVYFDVSNDAEQ